MNSLYNVTEMSSVFFSNYKIELFRLEGVNSVENRLT